MIPPSASLVSRVKEWSPTVSVGILTADLLCLGNELSLLQRAGVRLLHIDVMDGCFTPTMTVGPPFVKALQTPLLKDVHLMIRDPLDKLVDFVAAGADMITVHAESDVHIHRVLQFMGTLRSVNDPQRGLIRGVALNPGTPLQSVEPLLDEVDMIVLLAVNPGWGGQKFIPSTSRRIGQVRELVSGSGRDILICVDGGITKANVAEVAEAGPDIIVTGSAVFDGKTPEENALFMIRAVRSRSA